MSNPALRLLRETIPPVIARPLARRFLGVRYTGDYASWQDAQRESTGYDAANILKQVTEAARSVRDGRAAYERDGVVFAEPAYRWPLLGCLLHEALRADGRLSVLDFGGALASVYFQHRQFFGTVRELRWGVVEQPMFVEAGRREFTNDEVSFHAGVDDAMRAIRPNVILFSGVLGWIEHPYPVIDDAMRAQPDAILIDRTPVTALDRDVVKLQRVPSSIYRASYPCQFLSRSRLLAHLGQGYELTAELPGLDDAPQPGATFGGFYFNRRATRRG